MAFITLGSAPHDEECACVGEPDYAERSRQECQRFIARIRQVCGDEPPGCRLHVKAFEHDFGTYREVVVEFDPTNSEAVNWAFALEDRLPATWE